MDCFRHINLKKHYSTNRDNLISEFYNPCISRSTSYDRAVGYFRNSVMVLIRRQIAQFAGNGGKIRLITSPDLTEDEICAFEKGYEWRKIIEDASMRMVEECVEDITDKPNWQFVATLIAQHNLDVKIAFKPGLYGIFHDKIGLFYDHDGDTISFIGSINETASAWDLFGNHESFEVFCSWTVDQTRVHEHQTYFERLWSNHEPGLQTIPFPDIARERLLQIAHPKGVEAAFNLSLNSDQKDQEMYPQDHQLRALSRWKRNGFKGIVAHATGSGKTYTALLAAKKWIQERGPVLIIVPSELLIDQWYEEIQKIFKEEMPSIMKVGGGGNYWKRPNVIEGFTQDITIPRITLATIQTTSQEIFLNRIRDGNHLLVIWDEVHWAGAPTYSSTLNINPGGKLGLSATPKRYGDPDGTNRLIDYFGGIIDTVTLAEAIEAGRLCRYNYYIHQTSLNEEERKQWVKLTREISKGFARQNSKEHNYSKLPQYLKMLIIKRSRIPKKAIAKVDLAANIINNQYIAGSRWLIYCEDKEQMTNVAASIRKMGINCSEYFSSMKSDKESTLGRFSSLGGIIVAIRCLDEGVNIPSVDHALILASSKNPREFIQRRGRILRQVPGKYFAEIHDVIITPPRQEEENEPPEVNILKTELARVKKFAESAANRNTVYEIYRIADQAGIPDIDNLIDFGQEED